MGAFRESRFGHAGPEGEVRRAGTHWVLELLPLESGEHLKVTIASATPRQARLHTARAPSCTARSNTRRAGPRRHARAHTGSPPSAAARKVSRATCTPARGSFPTPPAAVCTTRPPSACCHYLPEYAEYADGPAKSQDRMLLAIKPRTCFSTAEVPLNHCSSTTRAINTQSKLNKRSPPRAMPGGADELADAESRPHVKSHGQARESYSPRRESPRINRVVVPGSPRQPTLTPRGGVGGLSPLAASPRSQAIHFARRIAPDSLGIQPQAEGLQRSSWRLCAGCSSPVKIDWDSCPRCNTERAAAGGSLKLGWLRCRKPDCASPVRCATHQRLGIERCFLLRRLHASVLRKQGRN